MLFADIKGFTDYGNSHTPMEVVRMLSNLFTEFDKVCYKYDLYKLYTIGDCYVCMGFNDARNRNPGREAMNMVLFGFTMIDIIKKVRKIINFDGLDMRIGIHTVKHRLPAHPSYDPLSVG
jgi:phospholipid-translocating ATPase